MFERSCKNPRRQEQWKAEYQESVYRRTTSGNSTDVLSDATPRHLLQRLGPARYRSSAAHPRSPTDLMHHILAFSCLHQPSYHAPPGIAPQAPVSQMGSARSRTIARWPMGEKLANLWGRQREEPLSWELERERWATADHGLRASLGEALLHATGPLGRPSLRPLHPNI